MRVELKGIDKQGGHPSIKGMQQINEQIKAYFAMQRTHLRLLQSVQTLKLKPLLILVVAISTSMIIVNLFQSLIHLKMM